METSEVKYLDYIKKKFPQLDTTRVRFDLADGEHSNIVIINDEQVFKFARYDWSSCFLDNELAATNLARDFVTLPVPRLERLEKGIVRYNFIEGRPLYRNELLLMDDKIQEMVAEQLGSFLRQLHSIPLKKVKSRGIEDFYTDMSRQAWLERYEEIKLKVFPYCSTYAKEHIRQIFRPLEENENFLAAQPALIHGDPEPSHVLFDRKSKRLGGVIGFGVSGTGDPAYDVGVLLDYMGEAFIKRVNRYYGAIAAFIDRSRFYSFAGRIWQVKNTADMIATRDFKNFRYYADERDIMPIGSRFLR